MSCPHQGFSFLLLEGLNCINAGNWGPRMMRETPSNYILLGAFTLAEAVLVPGLRRDGREGRDGMDGKKLGVPSGDWPRNLGHWARSSFFIISSWSFKPFLQNCDVVTCMVSRARSQLLDLRLTRSSWSPNWSVLIWRLNWGYTQSSSSGPRCFHYKPTSYWGSPMTMENPIWEWQVWILSRSRSRARSLNFEHHLSIVQNLFISVDNIVMMIPKILNSTTPYHINQQAFEHCSAWWFLGILMRTFTHLRAILPPTGPEFVALPNLFQTVFVFSALFWSGTTI